MEHMYFKYWKINNESNIKQRVASFRASFLDLLFSSYCSSTYNFEATRRRRLRQEPDASSKGHVQTRKARKQKCISRTCKWQVIDTER